MLKEYFGFIVWFVVLQLRLQVATVIKTTKFKDFMEYLSCFAINSNLPFNLCLNSY